MNYQQLKQSIAKGKIAPVYLLYGNENHLIEDALQHIDRQVFSQGLRDFNYQLFYGEETQAADIINAALTAPMLAPRRLIVVKNIQQMKPGQLNKLSAYTAHPSPTTVLVLIGDKLENRRAWVSSLESICTVVRFYPLYERGAVSWIQSRVKEAGYRISPEATQTLLEFSGNELATLANQLEKLFAYTASEKRISPEDVELVAGRVRQHNIFELVEAIGNKRLEQALRILAKILAQGESPLAVLALISRQLRRIWRAKHMLAQGDSWDSIGRKLGLRQFFLKGFGTQVKCFSLPELESAFRHLLITDVRLKSGIQSPRLALEFLLINLCC
jgi:DNA polymerase-3 subunit delta